MAKDEDGTDGARQGGPDSEEAGGSGMPSKSGRKRRKALDRRFSAIAGGAAAVWLGSVFLLGLGWGLGLMGIGMILLIEQRVRRGFGMAYDLYWIAGGALALIGGMLIETGQDIRIGPVILIAIGLFAIISALSGRGDAQVGGSDGEDGRDDDGPVR